MRSYRIGTKFLTEGMQKLTIVAFDPKKEGSYLVRFGRKLTLVSYSTEELDALQMISPPLKQIRSQKDIDDGMLRNAMALVLGGIDFPPPVIARHYINKASDVLLELCSDVIVMHSHDINEAQKKLREAQELLDFIVALQSAPV